MERTGPALPAATPGPVSPGRLAAGWRHPRRGRGQFPPPADPSDAGAGGEPGPAAPVLPGRRRRRPRWLQPERSGAERPAPGPAPERRADPEQAIQEPASPDRAGPDRTGPEHTSADHTGPEQAGRQRAGERPADRRPGTGGPPRRSEVLRLAAPLGAPLVGIACALLLLLIAQVAAGLRHGTVVFFAAPQLIGFSILAGAVTAYSVLRRSLRPSWGRLWTPTTASVATTAYAVLLGHGWAAAAVAGAVMTLLPVLTQRPPARRSVLACFMVLQACALGLADTVLDAMDPDRHSSSTLDLLPATIGALVLFGALAPLLWAAIGRISGYGFRRTASEGLGQQWLTLLAMVTVSPLVAVTAREHPELLPMFAFPLVAMDHCLRVVREHRRARDRDHLTGLANWPSLLQQTAIAFAHHDARARRTRPGGDMRDAGAALAGCAGDPSGAPPGTAHPYPPGAFGPGPFAAGRPGGRPARRAGRLLAEPHRAPADGARSRTALVLLDLDRFRAVNDTLGHGAGDRLLQEVARRITQGVRKQDLVARLSGDEFAVLLPDVDSAAHAESIARGIVAQLAEPLSLDGLALVLEASAGVAVYPDHADDPEGLLRRADIAMYEAKAARNGVACYDPCRDRHTPDRLALLGDLRRALEIGEVDLHYQPKVAFDGSVVGVEALIRWQHPVRGRVSPDDFVGLAESSGLMPHLTSYVLDRALSQAARWRCAGMDVPIAVNVSARDVLRTGFAASVSTLLDRHDVTADALQLEITEHVLLEDPQRAAETITELRGLGVRMALDDFGTGYSSLVHLRRLPVDEIKIDRSFVARLVADEEDTAIVRSTVQLAHTLGLEVVAEGVEDDETWDRLRRLGCDTVQGWLVAAALPSQEATDWLGGRMRGGARDPRAGRTAAPDSAPGSAAGPAGGGAEGRPRPTVRRQSPAATTNTMAATGPTAAAKAAAAAVGGTAAPNATSAARADGRPAPAPARAPVDPAVDAEPQAGPTATRARQGAPTPAGDGEPGRHREHPVGRIDGPDADRRADGPAGPDALEGLEELGPIPGRPAATETPAVLRERLGSTPARVRHRSRRGGG
ncbi:diguanylate cyclase (GGDEF)-like protein [Allostreptomyces psammosilenae]|uniref:Diguanylate cyclase (GGDEF)-like protein n=1 Tax=Allostreptomyces psammosilenae TaxID=1892865 RepID=A0A852ZZ92_9ACTN|nr:diguanylate cyclase (GGDEF)-like protein [Allostreptomyces psammosilenae]